MSTEEWIECAVYSWVIQLKYSFETEPTEEEIDRFYQIAKDITRGKSNREQSDIRFGNIYWEPEEIAYLRICLSRGLIDIDLKEFAIKNVLWGRKSRMRKGVTTHQISAS